MCEYTCMKMKQEHFDHMKQAIDGFLARHPDLVKKYETGDFYNADKVQCLQTRFCFDVQYMAGLSRYDCDTLYDYLNDEHILTALKKICPKVEKRY